MMSQKTVFDEQAFTQSELEQYINQQSLLVSVEESVGYSIKCSAKSFLPNSETNCTIEKF